MRSCRSSTKVHLGTKATASAVHPIDNLPLTVVTTAQTKLAKFKNHMRPYFAIIIDSFRAAFASRVLYVLLGIIVLLLLVIAPLRMTEALDWKISAVQHMPNPSSLTQQLVERGQSDRYPEVKRIWDMMTEDAQKDVTKLYEAWQETEAKTGEDEDGQGKIEVEVGGNEGRQRRRRRGDVSQYFETVNELNRIIQDRDFYRKEDWEGKVLSQEIRALIDEGPENLNEERSRRLNRLLVGKALPALGPGAPTTLTFYYGTLTADWMTFSASREFVTGQITDVMSWVFDKFVMSIGLAIGILVTATIIPETFDPGSLNLLLSKPISRWGLYITKFAGGCTLMAICSTLLFFGLWLWMGLGIGLWDRALLWSIPIYILVFAIYYSVSAFIGLTYRSSTMAIVMTFLFWAVCFALGSSYGVFNSRMENLRLYDPATAGDRAFALDGFGNMREWDATDQNWIEAVHAGSQMGEEQETAIGIFSWTGMLKDQPYWFKPETDSAGRTYCAVNFIADVPFRSHQSFFYSPAPGEEFKQYGKLPRDAMAYFATDDGLLVVDRLGDFHFLDPELLKGMKPTEQVKRSIGQPPKPVVVTESDGPSSAEQVFEQVGPENPVRVNEPYSVAFNQTNQEIAIHQFMDSEHRILVYKKGDDGYVQDRSVPFDIGAKKRIRCHVEYQGNTILIAGGNGQILTFDADTLTERKGFKPESRFPLDTVAASPDGRWFAMTYANKKLWILDAENEDSMQLAGVTGQGGVSSVSFNSKSELCVIDRQDRVICYDADTMSSVDNYTPRGGWFEWSFRYVLQPIYKVFPKPSEFYKVVSHLSSSRDTEENAGVDLIGTQVPDDPFAPLWSGIGFMVFMLTLSCLVFHYKDY